MSDREKRLIDANELKDNFGFLRKMWSATEICGIIDAMPTADVTVQKWIPVSERLPEENTTVIAATDYGVVFQALYAYDGWDLWEGEEVNVTHWMPLPGLPKECE